MVGTTATSSPSQGSNADLAAGTLVDSSTQNFAQGPCEMPDESLSGQSGQPALWSMDAGCDAARRSPMPAMPDMPAGAMTQALTRPVASANSQTSSTLAARRRIRACWVNIGAVCCSRIFRSWAQSDFDWNQPGPVFECRASWPCHLDSLAQGATPCLQVHRSEPSQALDCFSEDGQPLWIPRCLPSASACRA